MSYAIPGTDREDQEHIVTSGQFRSFMSEIFTLNFTKFIEGNVGNMFSISRGLFLMTMFAGFFGVLAHQIPNVLFFAFAWVVGTMPLWLPVAAVIGGWKAWVWYIQSYFISNQKPMLLEVKMPRDLVKSPRGMDNALSHLWQDAGEVTFMIRKWLGSVRPIWALEIASFGGDVRFYVWTWAKWRSTVEAAIYSQYPEVEIFEAEDYASKFEYDPEKMTVYCTDHRYEPRSDAYPIKTYVEFELDKDPKEEYKVDPLATVIEHMSLLRPDEQIWLQIVFTLNKDRRRKPGGGWWEAEDRYTGMIKEEVDKIRKDLVGKPDDPNDRWKSFSRVQMYRINEQIRTMERNMSKHPYDVGMRGVYISDPDKFGSQGFNVMRWIWRPMGNPQYLNQMRPRRWHTPFDWPWQDMWDMRWHLAARRFFDCYRRRSHFYSPYILPHNMMSTEVISTFWHPISSGIKAPGVERIPAKKAEPPPNLPK